MTPLLRPEQEHPPEKRKPRQTNVLVSCMLAAVLVLGGGWMLQTVFGGGNGSAPPPAVAAARTADRLTDKQISIRKQKFEAAGGRFALPATSRDTAAATVQDTAGDRPAGRQQGRMVELTVWDDVEEDGDVVQIQSTERTETVALTHSPQTVLIPVQEGAPLTITGVRDGGGGITLGFSGAGQPVSLPVLGEGESIQIWLQ